MSISAFGSLINGDIFLYKEQVYIVIELIKVGACGCIPHFNAQLLDNEDIKAFFHHAYEIEKIEQYKINIDNIDFYFDGLHKIEYDNNLPIYCDKTVRPLIEDKYIEYESTDIWLLYFGLAEKDNMYYEHLVGNQWVAKSRARTVKGEDGLY